jgi:hypothetical protein
MKFRLKAAAALLSLVSMIPAEAAAQRALQSPKDAFGFEMGADRKLVSWPEIVQYSLTLSKFSDRVKVAELGKSTLGKPFIALTISAPENLKRLDYYRSIQARLADPRGLSEAESDRLVREGKAIVMITCNVHSTEIASSQTALEFAYKLATGSDDATNAILKNTILLLVPSLNPDGQQMVVEWYRKYVGTPFEACPLPELYHHFTGHDNNRDWYMFTQVETQLAVSKLQNVWHPQIVYDVHQMGSRAARIFVPPWLDPVDPNIDPILQEMTLVIGGSMATDLAAAGKRGVVINAMYDLWTPSRHYQNYHGGIRILSESASVRVATPITLNFEQLTQGPGYDAKRASWNYPDPWPGGEWKLRDIVDYQLITFWSCLSTAARERERLLRNFTLVGRRAVERTDLYAYVIPSEQKDPVNTAKLLEIMRAGMIEIHQSTASFTANGKVYGPGSYIIPLAQPYGAWAKTLLERQNYPDLREFPGGPPKRPYDVTAQTLPLLMGVAADLIKDRFEAPMNTVEKVVPPPGGIQGAPAMSGYVISTAMTQSSLAVNRLFKNGFKAFWIVRPLQIRGKSLAPGSIYLPKATGLDPFLENLARETYLPVYGLDQSPEGSYLELLPPRIGLYRSYVPSMDEGWTRWLLEQYEFPYQSLFDRDVRAGNLGQSLDVIVIPDSPANSIVQGWPKGVALGADGGRMPDEYTGGLGDEGVKALADFVEAGGTLVTLNRAADFAVRYLQLPVVQSLENVNPSEFYCPGSLLRVEIDTSHPLGFGLSKEQAAWVEGGLAFEPRDARIAGPVKYAVRDLLMSGWLLGGSRLQGKPVVLEVPKGKGKVILLGFRPQYRGQSYAMFPLFFNSLYYAAAKAPNGGR